MQNKDTSRSQIVISKDNSLSDDDPSAVFYPGIIDQKTFAACVGTVEQIIRDPRPDRIGRFRGMREKLIAQIRRYPISFDKWNAQATKSAECGNNPDDTVASSVPHPPESFSQLARQAAEKDDWEQEPEDQKLG